MSGLWCGRCGGRGAGGRGDEQRDGEAEHDGGAAPDHGVVDYARLAQAQRLHEPAHAGDRLVAGDGAVAADAAVGIREHDDAMQDCDRGRVVERVWRFSDVDAWDNWAIAWEDRRATVRTRDVPDHRARIAPHAPQLTAHRRPPQETRACEREHHLGSRAGLTVEKERAESRSASSKSPGGKLVIVRAGRPAASRQGAAEPPDGQVEARVLERDLAAVVVGWSQRRWRRDPRLLRGCERDRRLQVDLVPRVASGGREQRGEHGPRAPRRAAALPSVARSRTAWSPTAARGLNDLVALAIQLRRGVRRPGADPQALRLLSAAVSSATAALITVAGSACASGVIQKGTK